MLLNLGAKTPNRCFYSYFWMFKCCFL